MILMGFFFISGFQASQFETLHVKRLVEAGFNSRSISDNFFAHELNQLIFSGGMICDCEKVLSLNTGSDLEIYQKFIITKKCPHPFAMPQKYVSSGSEFHSLVEVRDGV